MHMIREDNPGVDAERRAGAHPANRVAQYVDLRHQQIRAGVAQVHCKDEPPIERGAHASDPSEEPSPQVSCCDQQLHEGDRDPVSEKCHEGHRTSVLRADAAGNDIG
jgi:hypothetical protein